MSSPFSGVVNPGDGRLFLEGEVLDQDFFDFFFVFVVSKHEETSWETVFGRDMEDGVVVLFGEPEISEAFPFIRMLGGGDTAIGDTVLDVDRLDGAGNVVVEENSHQDSDEEEFLDEESDESDDEKHQAEIDVEAAVAFFEWSGGGGPMEELFEILGSFRLGLVFLFFRGLVFRGGFFLACHCD